MDFCVACGGSGQLLNSLCPLCDGDPHFCNAEHMYDQGVTHPVWKCMEPVYVQNAAHPVWVCTEALSSEHHADLRHALEHLASDRREDWSFDARKVYHNLIDPNLSLQHISEEMGDPVDTDDNDDEEEKYDGDDDDSTPLSEVNHHRIYPEDIYPKDPPPPRMSWIPATCFMDEFNIGRLASFVPQLPPSQVYRPVRNVIAQLLTVALPELDPKKEWLPGVGKPLQVVVKAQRIQLGAGEPPALNYSGLWHVDGTVERVKAVILYYTRVDESMVGGSLSFIARGIHEDVCFGYTNDVEDAIRKAVVTVPVTEGSMLCFRNDELLHRVTEIGIRELQGHAASTNPLYFDERDVGLQIELSSYSSHFDPDEVDGCRWDRAEIVGYDRQRRLHTCRIRSKCDLESINLEKHEWRLPSPWQAHSVIPEPDPREQQILQEGKAVYNAVMHVAAYIRRTTPIPNRLWLKVILPFVLGDSLINILQGQPLVREFIALFVIDPKAPLGAIEEIDCMPGKDGYISEVPRSSAEEMREQMLKEQLRRKDIGSFVVVSTGNGDCHDLFHTSGVEINSNMDRKNGFTRKDLLANSSWRFRSRYIDDAVASDCCDRRLARRTFNVGVSS